MVRPIAVVACALLVVGCASQAEIAQQQREAEIAQCLDYGFQRGTEAFGLCRMQIAERRIQQQHADAAEMEAALGVASVLGSNWGSRPPVPSNGLGMTCLQNGPFLSCY
jgi:hypothetical protein